MASKDKGKNMVKTTKKVRKTKLDKVKRIDGQDDSAQGEIIKVTPQKVYRSIDELFGFHGATYKTYDATEYRTSLVGLNIIDIQHECFRVGLNPTDNRNIMVERLMKKFAQVTSSINGPQVKPVKIILNKEARAIIMEGANKPGQ